MSQKEKIKIDAIIDSQLPKVWKLWTEPKHIKKWNNASDEWHTTKAENDLKVGGKFTSRMEAKDGSMGFDFGGTYTDVQSKQRLAYTLDDGRKVTIDFEEVDGKVKVSEQFQAENQNSVEMQKKGWQAILNNFKTYAESN